MSRLNLSRTGDSVQDRNVDELQRWGVNAVQGQLGPKSSLAAATINVTPAVANPRGRVTVFNSNPAAVISDGGLNSDGTWTITVSAATTAQFLWLE